MRRLFTLVLTVVTTATAAAQQLPSKAAVVRIADSLVAVYLADRQSPGVAVAVVRGNDTLVFNGWGKVDLENAVNATPRSVFRIGSVTKQFTAAAVLQLVQSGKVGIDDAITKYLTTLPSAWKTVTVRQLLNHTSGIPSYTGLGPVWQRRWGERMTPDTIVALTADKEMDFAPGSSWKYDNTGYVLLGMLIEKVAGRDWGTDMSERFFKPLGLSATYNCLNLPVIPGRAAGYEKAGEGWVNATYLEMSQPYSAGALCSTIGDLVTWNRALHGGKVLSAESYRMMTTPEGAAAARKYGFGMGRDTLVNGQTILSHGGGIHGFITSNAWVVQPALSVTVLSNSGSARTEPLMSQLVRASLGLPLLRPQAPVPTRP